MNTREEFREQQTSEKRGGTFGGGMGQSSKACVLLGGKSKCMKACSVSPTLVENVGDFLHPTRALSMLTANQTEE